MFKVTYHSVEVCSLEHTERQLNELHKTHLLRHIQSTREGLGIVCLWVEKPEGEFALSLGGQLI